MTDTPSEHIPEALIPKKAFPQAPNAPRQWPSPKEREKKWLYLSKP